MSTAAAVRLDDVWLAYGGPAVRAPSVEWALKDVTLAAAPGEMVGLLGANGSGKTTILQAVSGVLRPQLGRVVTSGKVASLVDLAAGVHRDLTGHENLLIGGVLLGLSRSQVRARYDVIVEFAGLDDDQLRAPIRTYSAGMGLRLAVAVVLHCDAAVLLVDEVLAVGDESFQRKCLQRVRELQDRGCAVMLASHDLDLVGQRCDRAVVMQAGGVAFTGQSEEAVSYYLELSGGAPAAQDLSKIAIYGRSSRRGRLGRLALVR